MQFSGFVAATHCLCATEGSHIYSWGSFAECWAQRDRLAASALQARGCCCLKLPRSNVDPGFGDP